MHENPQNPSEISWPSSQINRYDLDPLFQDSIAIFSVIQMFQQRLQSAVELPHRRPGVRIGAVPQAPRAMVQGPSPALESLLEQIRGVEAKKLYPRLILLESSQISRTGRSHDKNLSIHSASPAELPGFIRIPLRRREGRQNSDSHGFAVAC